MSEGEGDEGCVVSSTVCVCVCVLHTEYHRIFVSRHSFGRRPPQPIRTPISVANHEFLHDVTTEPPRSLSSTKFRFIATLFFSTRVNGLQCWKSYTD